MSQGQYDEKTRQQLIDELSEARKEIARLREAAVRLRGSAAEEHPSKAIQPTDELFTTIFETITDGILLADIENRKFVYGNKAICQMLGYSVEEIKQLSVREIHPTDHIQEVVVKFEKQVKKEMSLAFDIPVLRKDGSVFYADVNSSPFTIAGTTYLIGVFRDVTARRKSEEQLQNSNETLQAIISASPLAILALDPEGQVIKWSPAAERIFGWSEQEIVGKKNPIIPEDKQKEFSADYSKALAGQGYSRELRRQKKDGSLIDINITVEPLRDTKGHIIGALGIIEDITEQKRTEERLKEANNQLENIIEFLPDATFIVDKEKKIIAWNRAIEEMTGVVKEDIIGAEHEMAAVPFYGQPRQYLLDLIDLDDEELAAKYSFVIKKGQSLYAEAYSPFLFGGSGAFIWVAACPLFDSEGNVIGAIESIRDITDLKRAEKTLRESEERYRLITENMNETVWLMDMNLKTTYISPSVLKMRGYTLEELNKLSLDQHMTPESFTMSMEALAEILSPEKLADPNYRPTVTIEQEFFKKDGTRFWSDNTYVLLRDADGSPSAILGVGRDTTERRHMEEALQEREETFRALAENSIDVIMRFDRQGRHLYVNQAVTGQTGIPPEAFIGKTHKEMGFPKELGELWENAIENVFQTGEMGRLEFQLPNGNWIDWILMPEFDQSGKVKAVITSARDITERKVAEIAAIDSQRRLADIIQFLPDATIVIDNEEKVVAWNRAMERLTGIEAKDMIGKGDYQYAIPFYGERRPLLVNIALHPDPEIEKKYTNIFRDGENVFADAVITKLRGGEKYITATASALRDESGQIVGAIELIRDVTDRKKADEEKRRLEDELRQAQKIESIGRLAGGIAHDFNNFLTGIKGNISLALMDLSHDDPLFATLTELDKASESAASLTRQLLAFSRKQIVDPKVVDLNKLIQNMHRLLVRLIGEDIKFQIIGQPELGHVKIDPGQFEQVLVNLAVNARDAMPKGGSLIVETRNHVITRAAAEMPPGNYVMLSVTDSGSGMTEDVKQHLFEPFFTTKPKDKGTGLGLATVYGLVKQVGGVIEIESVLGKGSVFKIYLPLVEQEAEPLAQKMTIMNMPPGNETILLVEDEPIVKALANKVLTKLGYKVLAYPNAGEAMMASKEYKEQIHLLVTDVIMPGVNGSVLSQELKLTRPEMKVLFTSGYTEDIIGQHGVLEKGLEFLGKPYSPQALAMKVREILDRKK